MTIIIFQSVFFCIAMLCTGMLVIMMKAITGVHRW